MAAEPAVVVVVPAVVVAVPVVVAAVPAVVVLVVLVSTLDGHPTHHPSLNPTACHRRHPLLALVVRVAEGTAAQYGAALEAHR